MLEYCDAGDLSQYIKRHGRLSEATAAHFVRHLASGLRTLRHMNVVHRDLKPSNLLLCNGIETAALPTLKIGDFGFARSIASDCLADTLCGSPLYMAPEVLSYSSYDAKIDLWSSGAILFEMLTGATPFNGANHVQLLRNIERVQGAELPRDIDGVEFTHACRALVRQLLRRCPVERLSHDEFFKHAFLVPSMEAVQPPAAHPPPTPALPRASEAAIAVPPLGLARRRHTDEVDGGFVLVASPPPVHHQLLTPRRSAAGASPMGTPPLGRPPPSPTSATRGHWQVHCQFGPATSLTSRLSQDLASPSPQPSQLTEKQYAARAHNLQRCAGVLDHFACEKANDASPCEALALFLLALQCVRGATACVQACGSGPGAPDASRLSRGGVAIKQRATSLGIRLRSEAGASAVASIQMPDAWPLAHAHAAALGRKGAGLELLARHEDALRCYSRALCLFQLLLHDHSSLPLSVATSPPLLSDENKAHLSAAVSMLSRRIRACAPVPDDKS